LTILIVDDEALLRDKIRSVLENAHLPVREYYLAANAIDAMKIVDEKEPDIVLSDIRMPTKTGLELAAYINEAHPNTPVILITGYSDFEYAQAAIKSRVFDYILKPVEADKLVASVLRAQKKLELHEKHERLYAVFQEYFSSNLETIRKQYIESLLFRRTSVKDADEQRELFQFDFDAYRLVAVSCGTAIDGSRMEGQYYCTYLVEKYIQELLPKTVTYVFGNLVFFLWEVRETDRFADSEALLALLSGVHSYARKNFLGIMSAGISQVSSTLSNIQNLRRQTSECLEYLQESGRTEFVFFEDIMESDQERWETESAIQELSSTVRSGNSRAVLRQFDQLARGLQGNPAEYILTSYLLLVSNVSFLLHELELEASKVLSLTNEILPRLHGDKLEGCTEELRSWLSQVCELISTEFQSRSNVVVTSVREFINTHYSEPIGLSEASRHVGRNPSYVSRLIKEYTGKNFTQLLTDKRIHEAKHLLKDTSLKVGEIAERVGYVNVRYFNRVFKATMNMSANDYRSFSAAFD
jgi:two-component system response regulator YesN